VNHILKIISIRKQAHQSRFYIFLISLLSAICSNGQLCTPDIFFHRYNGNAAIYTGKPITTVQNEIIIAGATLNFTPGFQDATDGWITKLSSRGNILWSKQYYLPSFNSGGIISIENATDSTYFATARFGKYQRQANGSLQELDAASFLMHLDKFGNLIWLKRITHFINDSYLTGITRINNDDFIITGNILSSRGTSLLVMKINLAGTTAWYKVLRQDSTELFRPYPKILRNGELLLTGATNVNNLAIRKDGYYFLKMNITDGSLIMNKAIYINQTQAANYIPVYNIENIEEATDDTLYFYTSFSNQGSFHSVPYAREAAILKLGTNGTFYSASGWYNTNPGCFLLDGKYNGNGVHTLLLEDGYKTIRADVSNSGMSLNEYSYPGVNGNLQGKKLLDRSPANRIVFSGRGQVPLIGLMKTENDGSINCVQGNAQMINFDLSTFFRPANFNAEFFNTGSVFFEQMNGGIGRKNYPLNKNTDCLETCCGNIPSDTTEIELCNATQYRLPDNSLVKQSGMYYGTFTTPNNCDSIAYYDVLFSKKPIVDLGDAVCLGDSNQVLLKTDSGYRQYVWNGVSSPNHYYTATSPGIYKISVTNQCGTTKDEIEVFQECEFPVYIPTGFTPNNDGLNDHFGYPLLNKNRFVSMSIYNRYGERIFFTTDRSKSWDGRYKTLLQPGDVYAYLFYLETLNGKKITQKGTFVLIR
jgi:gliding motility-associated-like protein